MENILDVIQVGDLFSIQLDNGIFGLVHVIRSGENGPYGKETMLFVGLDFFSKGRPQLRDFVQEFPPVMKRISFDNSNSPFALYIPVDFIEDIENQNLNRFEKLGNVKPNVEESQLETNEGGMFDFVPNMMLTEWRWRYDRENLVQDVENMKKRLSLENRNKERELNRKLKNTTLKDLLNEKRFECWDRLVDANVVKQVQDAWKESIARVIELGADAPSAQVMNILRDLIMKINEIDNTNDGFIETEEREDLFVEFLKITRILKLGDAGSNFDKWRTW